jgi:hypothetical protein
MVLLLPLCLTLNSQEKPKKKEKKKEQVEKADSTVVVSERKPDTLAVKQLEVQKKIDKLLEEKKKK